MCVYISLSLHTHTVEHKAPLKGGVAARFDSDAGDLDMESSGRFNVDGQPNVAVIQLKVHCSPRGEHRHQHAARHADTGTLARLMQLPLRDAVAVAVSFARGVCC